MATLIIHLFGKMKARRGDQNLDGLNTRKVQELFAYLLIHRHRLHHREALAGLLWPESTTAQSLKYLRQALWQLQIASAGAAESEGKQLLLVDSDWVGLNPQADIWLDVAVFEQAFARIQDLRSGELDGHSAEGCRQVVPLYCGDLLEGFYEDWCLYERERLQNSFLSMLDKLAGYCEAHKEYEAGLSYASQILQYDRARECTHQQLIRLHYLAGNRTAALRQYENCVAALEEELGVKPAKRTVALYEQIRSDQLDQTPAEVSPPSGIIPTPLYSVLDRLKQLSLVLTNLQRQVEHEIHDFEQSLSGKDYKK